MNVLLVLHNPIAKEKAVEFWRSRLTQGDCLYVAAFATLRVREVGGLEVHGLEFRNATFRGRGGSVLRDCVQALLPFWPLGARTWASCWPDFVWSVRSFDPDVVDLRWMPGGESLKARLRGELGPIAVLRGADRYESEGPDLSWRRYDPAAKVSIVLPVYNGARYIRQAIETCLGQTHRSIELVIVDDCSADETPDIVANYSHDSRVVNIRNARNLRLPGTLNAGFACATGEFLTWTSHDNFYAPAAIETLVRYLCTWGDIDFVYSAYHRVNDVGEINPEPKWLPPVWVMPELNPVGPFFLYRRVVYETVGDFRQDLELVEDYDYWIRVWKRFAMMRLPEPLYYYRHHAESLTAKASHAWGVLREKVKREHFTGGLSRETVKADRGSR